MRSSFQMPKVASITGRSSSITNAFINAIIPVVSPTDEEILEALAILGMEPSSVMCAYCGDMATEWDHLRPLVVNQRPTGYISEIRNLVPACGKCNQSKGNKPWQKWIRSTARLAPAARGVLYLEEKIEKLTIYERWGDVQPIDFESIVGNEAWLAYWHSWQLLLGEMRKSQSLASDIRTTIGEWFASRDQPS